MTGEGGKKHPFLWGQGEKKGKKYQDGAGTKKEEKKKR